MGTKYDQLDIDERYELYRLHEAGKAIREIGKWKRYLTDEQEETTRRSLQGFGLQWDEFVFE